MYGSYSRDITTLREQVTEHQAKVNDAIGKLESSAHAQGVTGFDAEIRHLKDMNGQLNGLYEKILKRNENLEQVVKIKEESIQNMRTTVSQMKVDMDKMKTESKQERQHLQNQIDDLKQLIVGSGESTEKKVEQIITALTSVFPREGQQKAFSKTF